MIILTVEIYHKEKQAVETCINKLQNLANRFQRRYKIDLPLQEINLTDETQEGIEKSRFIFKNGNESEVIVFLPELTTPKSICKDIRRAFKRPQKQAETFGNRAGYF